MADNVNGSGAPSFRKVMYDDSLYLRATQSIEAKASKWRSPDKGPFLMEIAAACPTVKICATALARIKTSFTLRLFLKASAASKPVKGIRFKSKALDRKKSAYYSDKVGEYVEVTEHPFLTLMRRPNPYDVGFNFWQTSFMYREILGESHIAIIRDKHTKLPSQLRLLASQWVLPILNGDGELIGYSSKKPGAEAVPFKREDILHLRNMSNLSLNNEGVSWVEGIIPSAEILIKANSLEHYTYENGCFVPVAVLFPDGNADANVMKETREAVAQQFQGTDKAGQWIFFQGATSIQQLSMSPKDMNSEASLESHRRIIRNAAGITEAQTDLNSANIASAAFANTFFFRDAIKPALSNHAEQLTAWMNDIYGQSGDDWFLAYDEIVESEIATKSKTVTEEWVNGGRTLNEYRAELGLSALDGPVGQRTYFELVEASRPQPQTVVAQPARETDGAVKALSEGFKAALEALTRPEPETKALETATDSSVTPSPEVQITQKDSAVATWKAPFSQTDYNEVVSILKEWADNAAKSGAFENKGLADKLEPVLTRIFQQGGKGGIEKLLATAQGEAFAAKIEGSFNVVPKDALDFLKSYTIRLADALTEQNNASLNAVIQEAIKEGLTPDEAKERVLEALQDRTEYEAERIARSEVQRAYNSGTLTSWAEAGVWGKRWLVDPSETCPICDYIEGEYPEAIPLGDPFYELGDSIVVPGRKSPYIFDYVEIQHPPAHPMCECSLEPELFEPESNSNASEN